MTTGFSIAHAVSLRQMQARRVEAAPQPEPAALPVQVAEQVTGHGFADTQPLCFRSEAFAEDVAEHVALPGGQPDDTHAPGPKERLDAAMLEAGAAVLRMTLGALNLARR